MVAGGVIADGQAGDKNHDGDHHNCPKGIGKTVVDRQKATDCFQHQKRGRAEGGIGDLKLRPLTKTAWRVAQGVIFHGFIGYQSIIVAANFGNVLMNVGFHGIRLIRFLSRRLFKGESAQFIKCRLAFSHSTGRERRSSAEINVAHDLNGGSAEIPDC